MVASGAPLGRAPHFRPVPPQLALQKQGRGGHLVGGQEVGEILGILRGQSPGFAAVRIWAMEERMLCSLVAARLGNVTGQRREGGEGWQQHFG